MMDAAAKPKHAGALRVFVSLADAAQRTALAGIVARAGHEVVAFASDADVTLSNPGRRPGGEYLIVSVGEPDHDPPGLLETDADPEQIDAAVRAVAAGLIVRAPNAAETGFRGLDESEGQRLLTPREIEVLSAIGEGLTNKAIARRLDISLHTVKFHVEAIFRKLGVTTRTAAITRASQWCKAQTVDL
jgi:DNA-binding CsgD family transcriptional regulator